MSPLVTEMNRQCALFGARLVRALPAVRGRGRLAQEIYIRTAGKQSFDFKIPMKLGHNMTVPASALQSWAAAFTGRYDDDVLAVLSQFIHPGEIVLDIGACFGFYSIPLAQQARVVGAHVVAIEPVHHNCMILEENVSINGLGQTVTVMRCGLGGSPAFLPIQVERSGKGNASIVVGARSGSPEAGANESAKAWEETIEIKRLDDLMLPPGRCGLIKMDVEGYELEVLAGAEEFVAEHQPVIFGEFSTPWLIERRLSVEAPLRWATSHGYRCFEVRPGRTSRFSDKFRSEITPVTGASAADVPGLLLMAESQVSVFDEIYSR